MSIRGNPVFDAHWNAFLADPADASGKWACDLHANEEERSEILRCLAYVDDAAQACQAFRVLFRGFATEQFNEVMSIQHDGCTPASSWIWSAGWEGRDVEALLQVACELGLDLNRDRKIEGVNPNGGGSIHVSELGEIIAFSWMHNDGGVGKAMQAASVLLAHGVPVDDLTCHAVLVLDSVPLAKRWFDLLVQYSDVNAQKMVALAHLSEVKPATLALFSALAAQEAVDEVKTLANARMKPLSQ